MKLKNSESAAILTKSMPIELREKLTVDKLEGSLNNWFKRLGLLTYSLYKNQVEMEHFFTLPSSSATISNADPDKEYHDITFWI